LDAILQSRHAAAVTAAIAADGIRGLHIEYPGPQASYTNNGTAMSQSKKLLVPFDPEKPDWNPNDFLIPWTDAGKVGFRGLKNGRIFGFGRIVYIGVPVTENDLFAKLVDSGTSIASVDGILAMLRSYLDGLQSLKVGNVVGIHAASEGDNLGFTLKLMANTPSGFKL
jgi:hypothetical protein